MDSRQQLDHLLLPSLSLQTCAFISRREYNFFSVTTLSPPVCISTHLNAAEQLASLYHGPMCMIVLIFLIFQLSRLTVVRRAIVDYSVINTLWALISFSYASLTYPSFQLLSCYKFNGKYVLYSDPSMECFGKDHLPYGILAILVILLLVIPIPLILFFMRSSPRLKPLVDVYMSYVKSDYPWWIAVSMCRRLVIAGLAAYIPNPDIRQTVLASVVQISLFIHIVMLPYRTRNSNIIEAALLGNTCVFAMLNVNSPSDKWSMAAFIVFLWPSVTAAVRGLFKQRLRIKKDVLSWTSRLRLCCHNCVHGSSDPPTTPVTPMAEISMNQLVRPDYQMRDRLLADTLAEIEQ